MPRLILRRCLTGTQNNKKVRRPSGALIQASRDISPCLSQMPGDFLPDTTRPIELPYFEWTLRQFRHKPRVFHSIASVFESFPDKLTSHCMASIAFSLPWLVLSTYSCGLSAILLKKLSIYQYVCVPEDSLAIPFLRSISKLNSIMRSLVYF